MQLFNGILFRSLYVDRKPRSKIQFDIVMPVSSSPSFLFRVSLVRICHIGLPSSTLPIPLCPFHPSPAPPYLP